MAFPANAADDPGSRLYTEVDANAYAGPGHHTSLEAYLDYAMTDHLLLWADGYRESGYGSAYAGLAVAWGGWTAGVGAGQYSARGERANILAPWLGYASDDAEFVLTVERYDNGEPAYWQGYAQRRIGRNFVGVYGETGFGVGPAATFVFNEQLRLRLAMPVVERGEAIAMATLVWTP